MPSKLCPFCKRTSEIIMTEELRRGKGRVFFCKNCEVGFLEKFITNEEEYYNNVYRKKYSHRSVSCETNPSELFNIYKSFQNDRLSILKQYASGKNSLLEIGASAGQFLVHVKDLFPIVNAIELDSSCVSYIQEMFSIDADNKTLEHSKFKNKTYDICCSFQVMEHTSDPKQYLQSIFKALNHKGIALIEVPNLYDPLISVWNIHEYSKFYYHEAHNFYFTEEFLRRLSQETGFTVLQTYFLQDYNLLNHLNWIMNKQPQTTCEIGLNIPEVKSTETEIGTWLSQKLQDLNSEYIKKLSEHKKTSNIMMVLQKK